MRAAAFCSSLFKLMGYNMKKCVYVKYMITVLTLLWMGVIFWFSAQPAAQSAGLSGGIIGRLQQLTGDIPVIGQIFVTGMAEHILRKGAHVAEYAVLGGLLLLCMRQYLPGNMEGSGNPGISGNAQTCGKAGIFGKYQVSAAFVMGALYAASDEYHQTFVPGRSGEIRDVCIDSMGVAVGIAAVFICSVLWKSIRKRKAGVEKLAIKE